MALKPICVLLGVGLAWAVSGWAWADGCLGPAGTAASYRLVDERAGGAGAVVEKLEAALGPEAEWRGTRGQWLHVRFAKADGAVFEAWLLCAGDPAVDLRTARAAVLRYVVRIGEGAPVEYRHGATGAAVLPSSGAWPWLWPAAPEGALADEASCLGHRYVRAQSGRRGVSWTPPSDPRVVLVRPDVLTGVPHNTRQADETRRYDESDYEYVALTRGDYETMIAAGLNCFRADAEQAAWCEEAGVFYWGADPAELAYPECLYRPLYLGPALFLDEPAVVTRDHAIRPRLREDAAFRRTISPEACMAAFETHYADVLAKGAATRYRAALAKRPDVDLGAVAFRQQNIYVWETMVSSAAYELLADPAVPDAIVFEPPGQLGARRTLPAFNMAYGCQIPVTADTYFFDIIIGFLRGAARASGKQWGVSIYGGFDRTDAPGFISRAYELGATRFFYWDSHQLACVPFGEVLAHTRHLAAHARAYPDRDLDRLRHGAETAILLPPGYNLGHVHIGRGVLWGLGELNLERRNREGVTYRTVMGHFFTEIERCLRLGVAFDLLWDLPALELEGYREVVRIREDGRVEVVQGTERRVLDGARIPPRPEGGAGPQLRVTLPRIDEGAPCVLRAEAHVVEGDAPVYYAPAPDRRGVHRNERVCWELYGPNEEDCAWRPPTVLNGPAQPHPGGGHVVKATLRIDAPGRYRLRAATTDLAGRSAVAWTTFEVGS